MICPISVTLLWPWLFAHMQGFVPKLPAVFESRVAVWYLDSGIHQREPDRTDCR